MSANNFKSLEDGRMPRESFIAAMFFAIYGTCPIFAGILFSAFRDEWEMKLLGEALSLDSWSLNPLLPHSINAWFYQRQAIEDQKRPDQASGDKGRGIALSVAACSVLAAYCFYAFIREPKLNPLSINAVFFFLLMSIPTMISVLKLSISMTNKLNHVKKLEYLSTNYKRELKNDRWNLKQLAEKFGLTEE